LSCAAGNTGYFQYFGAGAGPVGKGYYSYNLGAWHVARDRAQQQLAFAGGCGVGSEQEQWLRADHAANPASCTVVMWHHPRFSSGTKHGSNATTQPFWQALYDAGAELVLAGHEHAAMTGSSCRWPAERTPTPVADPATRHRERAREDLNL